MELGLFLYQREFVMFENPKNLLAKRVDIVQVRLVREKMMFYKHRRIRSPQDAYKINEGIFRWRGL